MRPDGGGRLTFPVVYRSRIARLQARRWSTESSSCGDAWIQGAEKQTLQQPRSHSAFAARSFSLSASREHRQVLRTDAPFKPVLRLEPHHYAR
jgi:hypothetical protein